MIFAFIGFYFFEEKNRPHFLCYYLFCILDIFPGNQLVAMGTAPVFGQVAFIPAYALLILPIASFVMFIS